MSEKKLYSILSIVLWVISSVGLWEVVYELSHMIGAIVSSDSGYALNELLRMLPLILSVAILLIDGMFVHSAFVASSNEIRTHRWKLLGIFNITLSTIVILYIFLGVIIGLYPRLIENYPTPLFPLIFVLFDTISALFGYCAIKKEPSGNTKYQARHVPFVIGTLLNIFATLSYFVSNAAFGGFVYGLFILDWNHGAIFYNVMLLLMFGLAFGNFILYRFVYCELPAEKKISGLIKMSTASLVTAVAVVILYMFAVHLYPEAPNQNAFAMHPIDFTAGVNAFLPIYGINNIMAPLFALIYAILSRRSNTFDK